MSLPRTRATIITKQAIALLSLAALLVLLRGLMGVLRCDLPLRHLPLSVTALALVPGLHLLVVPAVPVRGAAIISWHGLSLPSPVKLGTQDSNLENTGGQNPEGLPDSPSAHQCICAAQCGHFFGWKMNQKILRLHHEQCMTP